MKKVIVIVLSLLVIAGLTLTVLAVEATTCTVTAENVSASAGGQITVPVKISSNPGFTNFAIALDYDREVLELVSIESGSLCGDLVGINTEWDFSSDENAKDNTAFTSENTYGYVTCALAEAASEDGILFTATFNVSADFEGDAKVTPIVSYMRNNSAVFSLFEEISAKTETGTVELEGDVVLGDVNGDGKVTAIDALLIYRAYKGSVTLTEQQQKAADVNNDGRITVADALGAYKIYKGV